jgi:hypothetical protein
MGTKRHTPEWWEDKSYGGGHQSWPKSSETFNDKIFDLLKFPELAVLELLTWVAWKENDWIVQASAPFIRRGLKNRAQDPAIYRYLQTLSAFHLITVHKEDYDFGHHYLVTPAMLIIKYAEPMKHYDSAKRLLKLARMSPEQRWAVKSTTMTPDLLDRAPIICPPDQNDRAVRSRRSGVTNSSRTTHDLLDREDLDPILSLGGAQRHAPAATSAGGVVSTESSQITEQPKGVLSDSIKQQIENLKNGLHPQEGRPFLSSGRPPRY